MQLSAEQREAINEHVRAGKFTQQHVIETLSKGKPAAVAALVAGLDEGDFVVAQLQPEVREVARLESTFAAPQRKIEASVWASMTAADRERWKDMAP